MQECNQQQSELLQKDLDVAASEHTDAIEQDMVVRNHKAQSNTRRAERRELISLPIEEQLKFLFGM
jgi:hypothetical protein